MEGVGNTHPVEGSARSRKLDRPRKHVRGLFFGEPVWRLSQDEYANALRKAAVDDGLEQDDVNLVAAVAEATSKPVYDSFGAIAAEVGNHECDMHGRGESDPGV